MTVFFEEATGRLRLDAAGFDALAAWATGADPRTTHVDELRAAGVVNDDGSAHPALEPRLGAIATPVCRLSLLMRDRSGREEQGQGWISADTATLLLDLPGGLADLVEVHPTFLPVALARIVELGPRPRVRTEPIPVRPGLLSQLLDADPARRDAAEREVNAAVPGGESPLVTLAHRFRRQWQARITWRARPGTASERGTQVVDTDAGMWLVEPTSHLAQLWPTTPTAVWRALTALLPHPAELAEPSDLVEPRDRSR